MSADQGRAAASFGPFVAVVEEDAVALTRMVEAVAKTPDVSDVQPFLKLDEVLERGLAKGRPNILVLGPSQADEDCLERVGALLKTEPELGALLVFTNPDASMIRVALRAGLDDAVSLDLVEKDLPGAIRDLGFRLASAVIPGQPAASAPAKKAGRVTVVFSPKGGVGKSVLATNLAAALAHRSGTRVVLVDLDLQFGDVAVMLRLNPVHHIGEALAASERLDTVLLESLLVHDERSRVDVLAAPANASESVKASSQSLARLFEVLRGLADHVVVDTPPVLDEIVIQALSDADDILYIVGMDIPSVKNARLGLEALELVRIPLERVIVVLNRANSRVNLAARDVERVLKMKVDINLPSDSLVPQSVNRGLPAVLEFGRSAFAGRMREVANLIFERAYEETENP